MADFRVAAVFSDNCVLQRDKNVSVFGEGPDGLVVYVTILGGTYHGRTRNGRWTVIIPPMKAQNGITMEVRCADNVRVFKNIAVGEVWLAGGQSNMELEIHTMKGGEELLKTDKEPNVRFYYTQKIAVMDDAFFETERNTAWSEFGEEAARAWSAVGYLFAKKLAAALNVTVGIIGCNWGGTSSSCWMSREALLEDEELSSYVDEYDRAIEGKSVEQQKREYAEYEEYNRKWDEATAKIYAVDPCISWDELQKKLGPNKWPGPMCCVNPFRPAGLYECMLKRVMPYTLKGFLYYQGESDDHKPRMYYKLFCRLIRHWREDWNDDELPFLFVQLPMHRYSADPDYKHWCLIREAQQRAFRTVKNTGMAVIIDAGEFNEIHPKDKEPVGERLFRQAMYHVYHLMDEKDAFGPMYDSCIYRDGGMELFFRHADGGIVIKDRVLGFEIAGEDRQYYPADAQVRGNSIFVKSDAVPEPVYARYLWTNYGDVDLFGTNGIPVEPFRTDRNDEASSGNADIKIQQVMEL